MVILVFGSINMDLVVRTPRLPVKGETISGTDFYAVPGGKGANQAVASSRLGASTRMIGRVGSDIFADNLLDSLAANKVDTSGISIDSEAPSGVALIQVDDESNNSIVIVPGANSRNGQQEIQSLTRVLVQCEVLLLQLEIPIELVVDAARVAHEKGVRVILDPAPAKPLPEDLYYLVDILTPNEIEASHLVGFPVVDFPSAQKAGRELLTRGVRDVVIKMGERGAFWINEDKAKTFPAYHVEAVDTVAAGDAFNAGLAVGLSEGLSMNEAIQLGMATAALSTTKYGAQPSMPDRPAVRKFLNQQA
jgi:ribokinase